MNDAYDILYDRNCGLCRTTRQIILTLGTLSETRFHDMNDPRVLDRFPTVDPAKVRQSVHVIDPRGRVTAGYDAIVLLFEQTHVLQPLSRLLRRPRFARMGRRLYGFIARHRHELFG